ncbi:MT-A70-domain-containing protein [Pseudoneurospora amorphoporcata]|uniref:MT-A70-domain-containing protein n=1 Tax=Pseudoneurospora amorphoporcata TaxID=241081 RepID=A0AAN6P148_9PEZI|nr:MT-A70-domain-containing protein [Pseudoneurospora amorphoporcata]
MVHSSVLYQNDNQTVLLLDLPRSLEEAQFLPNELEDGALTLGKLRYMISAEPPSSPFPTPEPKSKSLSSAASAALTASAHIAELMTRSAAESALEDIRHSYDGGWCLPRHCPPKRTTVNRNGKRGPDGEIAGGEIVEVSDEVKRRHDVSGEAPPDLSHYIIPKASHYLLGTVESQRSQFLATAPKQFDLILMDPPWPNRSAKRKRGIYQPVRDTDSIRDVLSQIPVASHLSEDGLVAVWVTNSARAAELLTCPQGIFDEWGVEPVGEWIWLKVTTGGEPIVSLDSAWRKPWERLLLARKRGTAGPNVKKRSPIETKVIVTVPDLHSRKPNLRGLVADLLPLNYQALEVFARNLTAGWWSWGDQCLLFQHRSRWVEVVSDEAEKAGLPFPPKER